MRAKVPSTGDPGRCGGFHEAACGAREEFPRRAGSDPTSGTRSERAKNASLAQRKPHTSRGPLVAGPLATARHHGAGGGPEAILRDAPPDLGSPGALTRSRAQVTSV